MDVGPNSIRLSDRTRTKEKLLDYGSSQFLGDFLKPHIISPTTEERSELSIHQEVTSIESPHINQDL
jgi:hypothetical protein